jgi:hypothetical protein
MYSVGATISYADIMGFGFDEINGKFKNRDVVMVCKKLYSTTNPNSANYRIISVSKGGQKQTCVGYVSNHIGFKKKTQLA